jgi:hypothetical protein
MGQTVSATSQVIWRAPVECPQQAAVIRQVEQLLGQNLEQPREQAVSIVGQTRALENHRYQVELVFTTAGQRRTRRLQHDNCTQLSEGAALVMAMAIDPERVHLPAGSTAHNDSPSDSQVPAQGSPARIDDPRLFAPGTTKANAITGHMASPVRWHAGLGTQLQSGLLPSANPGLTAELSVVPMPVLRFGFAGNYGMVNRVTFDSASGAQAEFTQWGAGARGCWQGTQRLHWAVCTQVEFGRIRGVGRNVTGAQTRTDNYSAALAELEGGYGLTHWLRLQMMLGAGLLLGRPQFTVEGLGEVHRPSIGLLRGTAGVAVTVP